MIYCTNIPKSGNLVALERQQKQLILKKDGKLLGNVVLADTVQKIAYVMDPKTLQLECIREFDYEIVEPAPPPPVDRSKAVTIGGTPVGEHLELKENGQQKDYIVLTAEERAKGFVRPVRTSYQHVGTPGPKYALRDLTDSEKETHGDAFAKFEVYPESESPKTGRFWTQKDLDAVGKGCGGITTMGRAIAETYARDPYFYGGTFCCNCAKHLPVGADGEFVWNGTNERVGE